MVSQVLTVVWNAVGLKLGEKRGFSHGSTIEHGGQM